MNDDPKGQIDKNEERVIVSLQIKSMNFSISASKS